MAYPQIDRAMESGVAQGVFPGGVLLFAKGRNLLYHRAFGTANLMTGALIKTDSIFDLASLTKPLATALAMAELIKDKKITLGTRLGDVIPQMNQTPKTGITMDMLLRHTSGLPAHREYFKVVGKETPEPRRRLRELLLAEPLEAEPGHIQVYSDLGYMVLAWVVEILSGQRLDAFVLDHIYTPLGLPGLFFMDLGAKKNQNTSRRVSTQLVSTQDCPWRQALLTGEVEDENAWAVGGIDGHAGLFGDALSVYQLCCEIMDSVQGRGAKVLDPEVIQAFVQKEPGRERVAGFDTPATQESSAGSFFSQTSLGHLGFTGTSFWMDPESGLIVVLLTNRVHPSRKNVKIKEFRPWIHDLISMALG